MSWRTIIIASSAKLDYKMDCMVVRQEQITKIYLNEIYMLVIESTAVSITASLMAELMKRKIKVIFCDEKGILPESLLIIMAVMIQAINIVSK